MVSQIASVSLEEELGKNPRLEKSDIEHLQEWSAKQPHLPKISDSSLALFLHSNYYIMEDAKATIDNYYTMRTLLPEFFADRLKDLYQASSFMKIIPLNTKTKEGYNIVFATFTDRDSSSFNLSLMGKYIGMVFDLWLYRSGTILGHILVVDVQNLNLGHATRCNPMLMKKMLYYVQDALPVRFKGIHYCNANAALEAVLKIMRPFLKKELISIIQLHSSDTTLRNYVPIEALPNELGGEAGSLKELHDAGMKELQDHKDWFLAEELRGRVDESKRIGKPKSSMELFGAEGCFKKLDVD